MRIADPVLAILLSTHLPEQVGNFAKTFDDGGVGNFLRPTEKESGVSKYKYPPNDARASRECS